MRRRQPAWFAWLLAALLLCQQVALAAHICQLPAPPMAASTSDCMQAMDGGEPIGLDCVAHCADPAKHGQDGVALSVPPLLPAVAQPRTLLASAPPVRDTLAASAAQSWRRQHASTILLI